MSISAQEYAWLSNYAYEDAKIGADGKEVAIRVPESNVKFNIIARANNPETGYQGIVCQREGTGEIVVAHRGTDEFWKDVVVADGSMVAAGHNPQIDDAMALMATAERYAKKYNPDNPPEVSVTGHSLGGTLAQITAFSYNVHGETFNAYGAASLDAGIPAGPNDLVTNHVMAGDIVSSASPHFGNVVVYASDKEISRLHMSGYFSNPLVAAVVPRMPLVAASLSIDSHHLDNFMPLDRRRNKDVSILDDPQALERAKKNASIIEAYRSGINDLRGLVGAFAGILHAGKQLATCAIEVGKLIVDKLFHRHHDDKTETERATTANASPRAEPECGCVGNVHQLLEAVRSGDPAAMHEATRKLQDSAQGIAWQNGANSPAQSAPPRDMSQEQVQSTRACEAAISAR